MATFTQGKFKNMQQADISAEWLRNGYSPSGIIYRDPPGQEWHDIRRALDTIITVLQGEVMFTLENKDYVVQIGDELIINAHVPYASSNLSRSQSIWMFSYRAATRKEKQTTYMKKDEGGRVVINTNPQSIQQHLYSSSGSSYTTSPKQGPSVLALRPGVASPDSHRFQPPVRMQITVGPVIGLVTHCMARILLETDGEGQVTCLLTDPHGLQQRQTVSMVPNRPSIFIYEDLQPSTRYNVSFPGLEHVSSGFTTFSEYPRLEECLNIGLLSCNNYRITTLIPPATDIWQALADRISSREVSLLIHLGDQVYGDDDWSNYEDGKISYQEMIKHCRFAQAKELLKNKQFKDFEVYRPQITELYRDAYREAWCHPPTRRALANCPSIMMYDDHEIRDDLGDKPQEFDPESDTYFIAHCGRRACFEYQRQLYEDFDFSHPEIMPSVERENHIFHVMGDYGFMMVDSRGAKTFNQVPGDPKPFLTSAQWADIHTSLGPAGIFASCKLLFFFTQIPIVFFPPKLTEKIAKKADDFEGMWSYKNNAVEQTEMLDALFDWKKGRPGRHVFLGGGDVHLGGFTQVFKDKIHVFDQVINGPVSNNTISRIQMAVVNMAKELCEELDGGWSFEHYQWEARRNVSLLYTKPAIVGEKPLPQVECSLLIEDGKKVEERKPQPPKKGQHWWKMW